MTRFWLLAIALVRAAGADRVHRDLEFGRAGDVRLLLDLYLPESVKGPAQVIISIHGGGWHGGSKERSPGLDFTRFGYAVASINYRLTGQAAFPAQIHDCKAGVRWLRANARQYSLDPARFAAWGASAGGHLAALLGTSAGVAALERRSIDPSWVMRSQTHPTSTTFVLNVKGHDRRYIHTIGANGDLVAEDATSLRFASALGASCTRALGCTEGIFERDEALRFIERVPWRSIHNETTHNETTQLVVLGRRGVRCSGER